MGIKFQSPIDLSAHRAIRHSDTAQTLEVKVVTKTAAHPEHGNGSSNGYTIDGIEGAYLEFTPGNTYKFDQSDSSNSGHPLLFYEDAAKTTAYTTGVTNNHSTTAPGNSGSYTQIIPTTTTPPVLFYQCSNHSLMGSYVKFGTGTIGDTYSINATQDGNNVDLNLDAASGTDSTVQLTAGTNITLTRNDAQQITVASTASGDTYDLNATQDGNNVDINLTSGSGSDNSTVQLTAGSNVTLTRNGAQEVTIAASGGSQGITIQEEGSALSTLATTLNFTGSNVTASGTGATKTINVTGGSNTVTVEKNVYTANGSTAAFNTSTAIANENNVQVYIDGVYQSKDDYTTSGSTVTLDSNPANGAIVELIHMVAVSGVIATDSFTGDGSTTAYVLSMSISNENATQVYLDGVYQSKDNYSTSGSTLTFSTAPSNGTAIEVVHLKAVNATSINQNSFTGDGSDTTFTLSQAIDDENKTFVFIQGVYQEKSTYSISGTTLTFSTAPQNGYTIEVMAFDSVTIGGPTISNTDWQSSIKTANFTAAAGKGYFVNTTSSTITVTLPSSPSVGDEVVLQDYAGTFDTNKVSITSSDKIQGSTDDYKCITENATVRLIYQDSTKGWTADNISSDAATIEYLVVAGGGGSSSNRGTGGGGAGGLRTAFGSTSGGGASAETAPLLATSTNYTVTVGAGGAAASAGTAAGSNGSNSVFSTITSTGGGGGPSGGSVGGNNGGSGSGGGSASTTKHTPGTGTSGQGYAGGVYYAAGGNDEAGGGGGGAGAAGSDGYDSGGNSWGGAGGVGLAVNILTTTNAGTASVGEVDSSNLYFAGGGGGAFFDYNASIPATRGGAGGLGGGGNGGGGPSSVTYNAEAGTANTGGGAGGVGANVNTGGFAGGSGVVILRYPSSFTLTVGSGLTQSTGSPFTESGSKVSVFTAGTGTVSFS